MCDECEKEICTVCGREIVRSSAAPFPIFGIAAKGSEVSVTYGKETVKANVNKDGEYVVDLANFVKGTKLVKYDRFHGRYHTFGYEYKYGKAKVQGKIYAVDAETGMLEVKQR